MYKPLLMIAVLVLAFGVGPASHSDDVYKWVDAQGNVHYTDHPHPGAQKVQLPKTQTYQPPTVQGIGSPAQSDSKLAAESPTAAYQQFSIASPTKQATLWYVDQVPVSVSMSPALRNGDTLTYHLDDQTIGPTSETTVTFKDVPRGEHSVTVTLKAANGATLSAGPITFYVRQKSILSPKPPH